MRSSGQSYKRAFRRLLIEPFRQITFGIYIIALTMFFIVVAGWLFWSAFAEQYEHVANIFHIVDPADLWELQINNVFWKNFAKIASFFVIFIFITFGVVFSLTHRYYGPLVSIERFIEQLIKGHYHARLTIRKKDELLELVEQLNRLAEKLEARHGRGPEES